MEVRRFKPKQAVQFIPCGWRLWKKNLMTWWLIALVLSAATMLLVQIEVVGEVVTLFMLPLVWTGSLLVADRLNNPEVAKAWRQTHNVKSLKALRLHCMKDMVIGGFAREHRIIELVGMAMSMIVFGIVMKILMGIVGGSGLRATGHFWQLSMDQFIGVLAAYGILYLVLYFMLMAFFYGIPLFIIRDEDLIPSLKDGLAASLKNFIPITTYLLAFFGPLILLIAFSGLAKFAFFIIFIFAGSILWPLFINSQYCAYRLSIR